MDNHFTEPMLASPPDRLIFTSPTEWMAEEKYDGIRLLVSVAEDGSDLFGSSDVRAWSREGNLQALPSHVVAALRALPSGIYDGELYVPGKRSYGAKALANSKDLVLAIFDVLDLLGTSTLTRPYSERRAFLAEMARAGRLGMNIEGDTNRTHPLVLAWAQPITGRAEVAALAERVWARDGEGLILKRTSSPYRPGKRSRDWVKIKQLRTAVLRVTGFLSQKRGPCSVTCLVDSDGNSTTVATAAGRLKELAIIAAAPQHYIGRLLRIEYQERTQPDDGYRHPRWDRWED